VGQGVKLEFEQKKKLDLPRTQKSKMQKKDMEVKSFQNSWKSSLIPKSLAILLKSLQIVNILRNVFEGVEGGLESVIKILKLSSEVKMYVEICKRKVLWKPMKYKYLNFIFYL